MFIVSVDTMDACSPYQNFLVTSFSPSGAAFEVKRELMEEWLTSGQENWKFYVAEFPEKVIFKKFESARDFQCVTEFSWFRLVYGV